MSRLDPEAADVARKVLLSFTLADPEADHPEDSAWQMLIADLPGDQARLLPRAMADCLLTLAALQDEDRLRILIRLIVAFDMVETIGALSFVARSYGVPDSALAAAATAASPGVAAPLVTAIQELRNAPPINRAGTDGHVLGRLQLSERQLAVFDLLLDPSQAAQTPAAERLRRTRWPGLIEADKLEAPHVIIEESAARPAGPMWLLISELHASGASIRRLFPDQHRQPPAPWFPRQVVSVGWEQTSLLGDRARTYLRLPAELFSFGALNEALDTINEAVTSLHGVSLDLSGSPRFLKAPRPPRPTGRASTNILWASLLDRIKRYAFEAAETMLTDPVAQGAQAYPYDEVLRVGTSFVDERSDELFGDLVRFGIARPPQDELQQMIRDAVNAAVAGLISQGKLRWSVDGADLQPIP